MLELEQRLDSLESIFERYLISNDNTLRRIEKTIAHMQEQAEQDRQRAEQDRQRAEQDRQRTEQDRQRTEQDRQHTDKMIAKIQQRMEQDQERSDEMIAKIQQRMEQDQERTDKIIAEIREQTEKYQQQTEKYQQQTEKYQQQTEKYQQQAEKDRRELNKKWGELANRLGTLAEDIVAPNLPRIAHEQFGCAPEPDDFMVRRWVRHKQDNSKRREFDVVVVYADKVFINETKSTPRINYIDDFIEVLKDIPGYFPEYQNKIIIPVFAALYLPQETVQYLTRHRIYALGMGDETMELLNFEQLR